MNNIYPFKAIMPTNITESHMQELFTLSPGNKSKATFEIYENKLKYIKKTLYKNSTDSFYCCRISNKSFSVTGLIALINSDLINKKIFGHERCVKTKKDIYLKLFRKYKTQAAPITLIHEDNIEINKSLNLFLLDKTPLLIAKHDEYKYEIWPVSDLQFYTKLYDNINAFLIADGHHRVSSIDALKDNKFITVFLVSAAHIKSLNIYREYNNTTELCKKNLIQFLRDRFCLTKINLPKDIRMHNKFLCKVDQDIFEVNDIGDEKIIDILEFLDKSINYKNNKSNFYNYPYNKVNNLLNSQKEIALLIPALKRINKIKRQPLYPPHSTLFYPKLPDGLISFHI